MVKAVRWTEAQLADHQRRLGEHQGNMAKLPPVPEGLAKPAPAVPAVAGMDAFYALGRMAKGDMNKTEAAYAQLLEAKKHAGEVMDWRFHPIRVRLADGTYYEPDFLVMTATRELQIHETKGGFTTDKGQLKIKLCAEVLPWFRVFKCTRGRDGWEIKEFTKR